MHFVQRIIIILSLSFIIAGCTTVPPKLISDNYLKDICEQENIQWQLDSVSQVIVLSKNETVAKSLIGSDMVIIGTNRIKLSAPLRRYKGSIIVPYDFKDKVLKRLYTKTPSVKKKKFVVVIDPGHGGKDPGAIGISGLYEKKVVLDLSLRLRDNLEKSGLQVVMTRASDEFISLEKRTEIAAKVNADLFISIHANAHPSSSVHGIEVYYCRSLGSKDAKEEQRIKNNQIFFDHIYMEQDNPILQKIVADMMFDYKYSESAKLATHVAHVAALDVSAKNLGSKKAGFFVLRNTLIPAVLIEVGFLSNKREEKFLSTKYYRQKLADSFTDSILEYVRDVQYQNINNERVHYYGEKYK